MCGACLAVGGVAVTTALGLERAAAVPAAFVAEMRASSLCPASAETSRCVAVIAPGMGTHPLSSAAQRSHWYSTVTVEFQAPVVVKSFLPTPATPERAGRAVEAGTGTTVSVRADGLKGDVPA